MHLKLIEIEKNRISRTLSRSKSFPVSKSKEKISIKDKQRATKSSERYDKEEEIAVTSAQSSKSDQISPDLQQVTEAVEELRLKIDMFENIINKQIHRYIRN